MEPFYVRVGRRMKRSVEFKDAVAILALIVSVTGLFFAATQMGRTHHTERGKFFKELHSPFFLDDQIRYAYDVIEKGSSIFPAEFRAKKIEEQLKRERAIETLFAQFEIIISL